MPSWPGQGTAEDWFDRACWLGSAALFSLFAMYSSAVMHWSSLPSPLRCLAPKEFNHAWLEHAETFCWEAPLLYEEVNKTSQGPYGQGVPVKNYLRWLPAVFVGIAVAMATPRLLWQLIGRRAHELVELGVACQWQPWLERSHATAYLADELRRPSLLPCCLATVYLVAKATTCGLALACLRLLGQPFTAVAGHPLGPARRLLLDPDWQSGLMPGAFHCEYGGQLHVHHQHSHQLVCEFAHESLVNCLCIAGSLWLLLCALASGVSGLIWLACLLPPVRRRLLARLQRGGLQQPQQQPEQQLACDASLLLMHIDSGVSGLLASDVLQQLARLVAAEESAAAAASAAAVAAAASTCDDEDQQERQDLQLDSPTAATALLLSKTPVAFLSEHSEEKIGGGHQNNNNHHQKNHHQKNHHQKNHHQNGI